MYGHHMTDEPPVRVQSFTLHSPLRHLTIIKMIVIYRQPSLQGVGICRSIIQVFFKLDLEIIQLILSKYLLIPYFM